jgi:hypothetical protein
MFMADGKSYHHGGDHKSSDEKEADEDAGGEIEGTNTEGKPTTQEKIDIPVSKRARPDGFLEGYARQNMQHLRLDPVSSGCNCELSGVQAVVSGYSGPTHSLTALRTLLIKL